MTWRTKRMLLIRAFPILTLAAVMTPPAMGCDVAELVQPAPRSNSADPAPLIVWRKIQGVDDYRVEIESRVPEGEALVIFDVNVRGDSYRPPKHLTDSRAAVKVRISHGCSLDHGHALREMPATFFIDTAKQCPAPTNLNLSANGEAITWEPQLKATQYVIATLSARDGSFLTRSEVQRPPIAIAPSDEPRFVIVKSYCLSVYGAETWLAIGPNTKK
jgi:hypothetical protein